MVEKPILNQPNKVILHCSATPDYPEPSRKFDLFGAKDIDAWHRARGFDEIGYHFVIRRTGSIERGRDVKKTGAHTLGKNTDSIGVCYIGTRWPTTVQVDSLLRIYKSFRMTYNISFRSWHGHNEFTNKKTCPGFSMFIFRRMLEFYDLKLRNEGEILFS